MFELCDHKHVFFVLYGRFHELLPTFLAFQGSFDRKTRYMFEIYDHKLVFFMLYGHFNEVLPMFSVFQWPFDHKTRYMFKIYDHKLVFSYFMSVFMTPIAHSFGVPSAI